MSKFRLISAASLMLLSTTAFAQDGAMPSAEQIMGFLDGDQDGFIQESEAQGPLAENFALIDTDKDGKISPAELQAALDMKAKMDAEKAKSSAPSAN
jgi:Ca2+-binding EF-hand superfamily protein